MMIFQAHKGVSTENPENTMPSFIAAAEQGYKTVELDVAVTKDLKFVILHDDTINRTARNKDGSTIKEQIKIGDITYSEALNYDFGLHFSKKFKGTAISLLDDVLKYADKSGLKLKIDNKYQNFTTKQKEALFNLLTSYENVACLTCSNIKEAETAANNFPNMHLHYDGAVNEDILIQLSKLFSKDKLTVWLPLKSPNTSWVKVDFAEKSSAELIKQYASLGIWILSDYSQLDEAKTLGADEIETNGQIKPQNNFGKFADMHTHSESSHDSVCKLEDMRASQIKNGCSYFAVTDHFDTDSYTDYDVFTPIQKAAENANALNADDKSIRILKGIEISEGFWHSDVCKKVSAMIDYDVIIGSVHLVKYKDLSYAYSQIDFSKLDINTIYDYLDAYFNDMLTMLKEIDFDILAHLTCPLRYIKGKYKINIDLSRYENKINEILQCIIKKGIALEVNTSSYDMLSDFMPTIEILKKYHKMGGYLITLGSDAHVAENAAAHFSKAISVLKDIGFKHIYYYKKRYALSLSIFNIQ